MFAQEYHPDPYSFTYDLLSSSFFFSPFEPHPAQFVSLSLTLKLHGGVNISLSRTIVFELPQFSVRLVLLVHGPSDIHPWS